MNLPNLKDLIISISEFKKQVSEVVDKNLTRIIIKNNNPVSVIMPYSDYIEFNEDIVEARKNMRNLEQESVIMPYSDYVEFNERVVAASKNMKNLGQEITLKNGVTIIVIVDTEDDTGISIKTYIKMKTSGEYKLHYTLRLSQPRIEETLKSDELAEYYGLTNT